MKVFRAFTGYIVQNKSTRGASVCACDKDRECDSEKTSEKEKEEVEGWRVAEHNARFESLYVDNSGT